MPQNLVVDLEVTLAAGASVTLPHGLTQPDNSPATPFEVRPDRATPIVCTAATSTTVSFNNPDSAPQTAIFRVWRYHSVNAPDATTALRWQGGGGGGGGGGFTFVYVLDPGGVAVDNVYTDFTSLYAAASADGQGAKLCIVRSDAQIPAGTYELENWQFEGSQDAKPTLAILAGVVIVPGTFPKAFRYLNITWLNPAAVSYVADRSFLCVFQNVNVNSLSTNPSITCGEDVVFTLIATDDTTLNRGTGPFVETINGAATVQLIIDGSSDIAPDVITGIGDLEIIPQGQAGITNQTIAAVSFELPDRQWLEDEIQSIAVNDTMQFDVSLVLVNTAGGPVTVTGDPVIAYGGVRRFTLQKTAAGNDPLIFTCDAGDTVNGGASVQTTTAYGRIELVSDGANAWYAAIY